MGQRPRVQRREVGTLIPNDSTKSVEDYLAFSDDCIYRGRSIEPSAHPSTNQAGMVFAILTIVMLFAPRVSATYNSFGDMDSASRMIA